MMRIAAVLLSALISGAAPAADPPQSIAPTARFAQACYGKQGPTAACDKQAIANINRARAMEGVGHIHLPANYANLTWTQQAIAVSNAERVDRGLSKLPERNSLDKLSKQGANANADPSPPPGVHGWGSIWAGVADPLAADFLWMYDDGPGGTNFDCVNPGDPGCWGHRHNIINPSWKAMGAGHDGDSLAELFVYP
jgi:uncharacterized protein YkwD